MTKVKVKKVSEGHDKITRSTSVLVFIYILISHNVYAVLRFISFTFAEDATGNKELESKPKAIGFFRAFLLPGVTLVCSYTYV